MASKRAAPASKQIDDIPVELSYTIVDLFSEDLYSSPNKAIEELVSNSFDAGAKKVHVLFAQDGAGDAAIAVIDDGQGMGPNELRQHWLIGKSNKRELLSLPLGRKQIGKFGIGKLATYVLANCLKHISKIDGKYYSTSMDYRRINERVDAHVGAEEQIRIPLYELTAEGAKQEVTQWMEHHHFKATGIPLFGPDSPDSWTVTVLADLKPKAREIKDGKLRWVLRTALPMRPDFGIWLRGEKLQPSKINKKLLKRWVIGKDLVNLNREKLKGTRRSFDKRQSDVHKYGIRVPGLGRVTGYAEVYTEKLTEGKSEEIGRSHGFFVYVYERLINVNDDHFGIMSNELRHGTFACFRLVIYMDELDNALRSNRESIGESAQLDVAREVLRGIFNVAHNAIEAHERGEKSGANLAGKLAASPASLSRRPIVELARAVVKGDKKSKYLIVPHLAPEDQEVFLTSLDQRAQDAKQFVTGVNIDPNSLSHDVMVKFDTKLGRLQLNRAHPFVDTFRDAFRGKGCGPALDALAMSEILVEAHLHSIGIEQEKIDKLLSMRDELLRDLANNSGRSSASSVAEDLLNASNNPESLEMNVVRAFTRLGFCARPIGGKDNPDGVAVATLSAYQTRVIRAYKVSLEAKSTKSGRRKVSAKTVGISRIARHSNEHECDHALVIAPSFNASKHTSAIGREIRAEMDSAATSNKKTRTFTLIEIATLAHLVKLRPVKQLTLAKIRDLFQNCILPHESAAWVQEIQNMPVQDPLRHRKIIEAIGSLQKNLDQQPVTYEALLVKLMEIDPTAPYKTASELRMICTGLAGLAPHDISAETHKVGLEQSVDNVINDIKNNMTDYLTQGDDDESAER